MSLWILNLLWVILGDTYIHLCGIKGNKRQFWHLLSELWQKVNIRNVGIKLKKWELWKAIVDMLKVESGS